MRFGGLRLLGIAFVLAASVSAPAVARASILPSDTALGFTLETSRPVAVSAPDVTCLSGIVQTTDGRTLWSRKPDAKRAGASTAKIMTALIVLKSCSPSALVTVTPAATTVPGTRVGLRPNTRYTVAQLLEAMLVGSGCDAAYALAQHAGSGQPQFVQLMNQEAIRLGMSNTHYVNPHGLDAAGAYTTSRDLARLTRAAMSNPAFRRTVALRSTTVDGRVLRNTDLLLWLYPGTTGVKTGTTSWAGPCIVGQARRENQTVTVVVLAAKSDAARYEDAARLLDWGVLNSSPDCISCFTTTFDPNNTNRVSNIRTASAALNGRWVGPGATTSFNGLVGERTASRGYVVANTVVGGELVPEIGGGVCQVSTTLFNAAFMAGMPIVERRPHSLYFPNYPLGRDAAVSWGTPDLRFSNATGGELRLRVLASGLSVTAGLHGIRPGNGVWYTTSPLVVWAPPETVRVPDPTLPPGTTRVITAGQPGLRTSVARTVRRPNGSIVRTDTFASVYPPVKRVESYGAIPTSTAP